MLKTIRTATNTIKGLSIILFLILLLFFLLVVKHDYLHLFNSYYYTTLHDTHDLSIGDRITYKGIIIGRINSFELVNNEIRFNLLIENRYKDLIREQSRLRLTPPFNLKGAIFGASLELLQGNPDAKILRENSEIDTVRSQAAPDLSELVAGAQEQIKVLVENLNHIFAAEDEEQALNFLQNIQETTKNVKEISEHFLDVSKNANSGIRTWTDVGIDTKAFVQATREDMHRTVEKMNESLGNFDTVMKNSTDTIDRVNNILVEARISVEQANQLLSKMTVILEDVHDITYKVNNSWLLKGKKEEKTLNKERLHFLND